MEADLATVTGPARPAILATQDRWLAMMGGWDVEATRAALAGQDMTKTLDHAEKDFGWRPVDATDAELVWILRERTQSLALLPAAWADFEALKARHPGAVAKLATSCQYIPADQMPAGASMTFCGGTFSLQLGTRLCSVASYSYGNRINTVFSVDALENGTRRHRGNCDWNGAAPDCPSPDFPDPKAHWDPVESRDVADLYHELAKPGVENDPEAWVSVDEADWFDLCLTTPYYPPPDQIWPGIGPRP